MSITGRTYRQLQDEVLSFQFAEGKYRPLVKTWLNDAQRIASIQSEMRIGLARATYSTETGEEELELPADYGRVEFLKSTRTDTMLIPLFNDEFYSMPEATGTPTHYTMDEEIRVYPTPDGTHGLELHYWRIPQDMVEDADVPSIPIQYHHILAHYAMWRAYLRENDYTAAAVWSQEWKGALMEMRGEVQHDSFDGPQQVAGSYQHGGTWR